MPTVNNLMLDITSGKYRYLLTASSSNRFGVIHKYQGDTLVDTYRVSIDKKKCSCRGFFFRDTCKHLDAILKLFEGEQP